MSGPEMQISRFGGDWQTSLRGEKPGDVGSLLLKRLSLAVSRGHSRHGNCPAFNAEIDQLTHAEQESEPWKTNSETPNRNLR
jgi:hypothetical protein